MTVGAAQVSPPAVTEAGRSVRLSTRGPDVCAEEDRLGSPATLSSAPVAIKPLDRSSSETARDPNLIVPPGLGLSRSALRPSRRYNATLLWSRTAVASARWWKPGRLDGPFSVRRTPL
jgi:hypothetical protein